MFSISDKAISALKKKLKDKPTTALRCGVRGGGCNGFTYVLLFEEGVAQERDVEYDFSGIKVLIDNKSLQFLDNCVLDWEESLISKGFVFRNPIEKSRCGCGKSFSLG